MFLSFGMSFYGPCSADRLVLKACEICTAALRSFAICEVIRCSAFVQLSINLSLGCDSIHKEYWFHFTHLLQLFVVSAEIIAGNCIICRLSVSHAQLW
jgi:hypothetical protein